MVYRVGDIALSGGSVQRVTVLPRFLFAGRNLPAKSSARFRNDHRGRPLVADRRDIVSVALIEHLFLSFYKRSSLARIYDEEFAESALRSSGFVVALILADIAAYPIEQHFGVDPTQQALSQSATVSGCCPSFSCPGHYRPIAEEIVFRGYLYKAFETG